ncbi:unnamed protein product [Pedinophyceae sp. YPF-701]|nr:unnamed protein product [Pedinophyceae sp. YPF-701]
MDSAALGLHAAPHLPPRTARSPPPRSPACPLRTRVDQTTRCSADDPDGQPSEQPGSRDYYIGRSVRRGGWSAVRRFARRRPEVAAAVGVAALLALADVHRFLSSLHGRDVLGSFRALASSDGGPAAAPVAEPTVILDRRGRVIATLARDKVPLSAVAPTIQQAVIAAEDRRFHAHAGVDWRGVARALLSLGAAGGGSTITQQVVKNELVGSSRTVSRKACEAFLAVAVERCVSKSELMARYLNSAYWGHGIYGIAAASAAYFGKRASDLDVNEAALLAGMLPAPEALSPFNSPAGADRVRRQVLYCMAEVGFLPRGEARRLVAAGLPASLVGRPGASPGGVPPAAVRRSGSPFKAPFIVQEVMKELEEVFGHERVAQGGLRVHTTVDLPLQEAVEALVLEDGEAPLYGEDRGECAVVATHPATGGVLAMVGSRSWSRSAFNRATRSRRSVASAFKPIVYLAAFAGGAARPSTVVSDEAVVFRREAGGLEWAEVGGEELEQELLDRDVRLQEEYFKEGRRWFGAGRARSAGGGGAGGTLGVLVGSGTGGDAEDGDYSPNNYNKMFRGPVTAKEALVDSLNVPAVRICNAARLETVLGLARSMGVTTPLRSTLSVAIGGCEITPAEVAAAYNTIAAGGVYSQVHLISKVEDTVSRSVVHRTRPERRRVARAGAVRDLDDCLRAAASAALGPAGVADLRRWVGGGGVAGKTGTSDAYRDAWFAGYVGRGLSCVVWCGRDDESPLPGTGAMIAAPLWANVVRSAAALRAM